METPISNPNVPPSTVSPSQNSNSTPNPVSTPKPFISHSDRSVGPVFGIIIIIVVLVIGGLYFWGNHLNQQAAEQSAAPQNNTATETQASTSAVNQDQTVTSLNTVTPTDSPEDIARDLQSTDLNSLDPGTSDVDQAVNTP